MCSLLLRASCEFPYDRRLIHCVTFPRRLFYALFIPYFYIQIYASFRGVPSNISSNLLAILNAMNIPSRILPGLLADRFGPYVFA